MSVSEKVSAEGFFHGLPPAQWAEWYLDRIPNDAKCALRAALLEGAHRITIDHATVSNDLWGAFNGPGEFAVVPLTAPHE